MAGMVREAKGTHMRFLRQITGNWVRQKADRRWDMLRAEVVWEAT